MKFCRNILILTFAVFLGFCSNAQSQFRFATNQEARVNLAFYDSVVNVYLYTSPTKAFEYIQEALKKVEKKNGNNLQKADLYRLLMKVYDVKGDPIRAMEFGYKVLLIYDLYDLKDKFYDQVLNLARIYFNASQVDEFFKRLLYRAYLYYKTQGDSVKMSIARIYINYFKVLKNEQFNLFHVELPYLTDTTTETIFIKSTVLADYYYRTGKLPKAIAFYKKLETILSERDSFALEINRLNLSFFYVNLENLRAAQKLIKQNKLYFILSGDVVHLAKVYFLESYISLQFQQYSRAIALSQSAIALARQHDLPSVMLNVYYNLSEIYSRLGKSDLAYYSYFKYISLRDSIYWIDRLSLVAHNQMKLSSLEKDKENYILRREKELEQLKNNQQKLIILIFGIIVLFFAILLSFVYYMFRTNLKYSQRLKLFAQVSQEGILIVDKHSILEYNDNILKMTGYSEEELQKLTLYDLLDKQVADNILEYRHTVFVETILRKKDRTGIIVEILAKSFPHSKSKHAKVVSIHNISEFRQAQMKLIESEQKFKTLIDTSPDGVILSDLTGKITYISKSALNILELNQLNDTSSLSLYDIFDEIDKPLILSVIQELKQHNQPLQKKFKIITPDNKVKHIDCRCIGVKRPGDNIETLFFIVRDVTKQYLSEEALRQSEQKFRGLFNKASDGIIIIDRDGYIKEANPKAIKIFGLNVENLEKTNFVELLPPTIRKDFSLKDILKSDKTFETGLVKYPDQLIYVQISVSQLSDNPKLYLFIIRDITELRQSQDRLKKYADKLEASNRAKAKLFSIISHDLRGPIGNFKTMLELILESPGSFNVNELREILVALKDTSVTTYELLENLLYWAKTQLDQIEYKPEVFQLEKIVPSIIDLFKDAALRKKITIQNFIDREDILVYADPNMVRTILRNLVSNAIKFTPHGGFVRLKYYADERMVIVAVEDTGIGIPQERLTEIFDSTKFISTRGTDNEKGTGIGLDIVCEFVQKNKGKIWVESKPGKGSTFYFSLPKPL